MISAHIDKIGECKQEANPQGYRPRKIWNFKVKGEVVRYVSDKVQESVVVVSNDM